MPSPFGNSLIKAIVNSPLHPLVGKGFAVITLTGRKTGQEISTPINVVPLDGTLTVISLRSRTWWRNLKNGQTAQLRHAGSCQPVRGEVVENPAAVAAGLGSYFARFPGNAKYFHIQTGADGQPTPASLEQVAAERILVRLHPVQK